MSGKTATERLREMLDERGVAHSDHYLSTTWRDGHGILHLAGEPMADGSLVVDMLTPEQAIAATLGNSRAERTCKQSRLFNLVWSECSSESYAWHRNELPNYCPNCGARVVE